MTEMTLRRLGYWGERGGRLAVPAPPATAWDSFERDLVERHLTRGFVARAYLGVASCQICESSIGSLELTDGSYIWPEGLAHYVIDHGVGLPREFVRHVIRFTDAIEGATVDEEWWRNA